VNRTIWFFVSFVISLLIHIYIIYEFETKDDIEDIFQHNDKNKTKINQNTNIRYLKLIQERKKEKLKKTEKTEKAKKAKKAKIAKKLKKIAKTKKIKKNIDQNNTKKLILKLKNIQTKQDKKFQNIDSATKEYLLLYGAEYWKYDKETKKFLKNNLNKIGEITKRYLYYPNISIKTKQEGINVVQFYLYPNGDISSLKIIKNSSYKTLDKNSYETIKLAYKDYPRPNKKTKIRIYIKYLLFGY